MEALTSEAALRRCEDSGKGDDHLIAPAPRHATRCRRGFYGL